MPSINGTVVSLSTFAEMLEAGEIADDAVEIIEVMMDARSVVDAAREMWNQLCLAYPDFVLMQFDEAETTRASSSVRNFKTLLDAYNDIY